MNPNGYVLAIALALGLPGASFCQPFSPIGSPWAGSGRGLGLNGYSTVRVFPQLGRGCVGVGPFVPVVRIMPVVPVWAYYPPPFTVIPPIVVSDAPVDIAEPAPVAAPRAGPLLPGQPAGRFRRVGPADRAQAQARPAPPPPPAPPPENPLAGHDRLIREGRKAFAHAEFGRAGELFRRAAAVLPERADSYLLLAQVGLALGKYRDAASFAHMGIRHDPGWPLNGPPLGELYGANLMAFARHRRAIDEAARAAPEDAAVQFMRAYALWFEGRRDEARNMFEGLRPLVKDSDVIDRFLMP